MAVLHDAFNSIDNDMSGAISTSELADLLKSMGTRATIEELEDMVRGGSSRGGQANFRKGVGAIEGIKEGAGGREGVGDIVRGGSRMRGNMVQGGGGRGLYPAMIYLAQATAGQLHINELWPIIAPV